MMQIVKFAAFLTVERSFSQPF